MCEEVLKNRFEKRNTVHALAVRREVLDKLLSDNRVTARLDETETWDEGLRVLVEEILKQAGESTKFLQVRET